MSMDGLLALLTTAVEDIAREHDADSHTCQPMSLPRLARDSTPVAVAHPYEALSTRLSRGVHRTCIRSVPWLSTPIRCHWLPSLSTVMSILALGIATGFLSGPIARQVMWRSGCRMSVNTPSVLACASARVVVGETVTSRRGSHELAATAVPTIVLPSAKTKAARYQRGLTGFTESPSHTATAPDRALTSVAPSWLSQSRAPGTWALSLPGARRTLRHVDQRSSTR